MGALSTNVSHVQAAAVPSSGSPVFVDAPGAVSLEQTVTTDTTPILADAEVYHVQYSAPEGSLDLTWLGGGFNFMQTINGVTTSSSGTGPTKIDRAVVPATYVAPSVIIAELNPNVDKKRNPLVAAFRTTYPRANFGVASKSSGQDSVQQWTASGTFTGDADGQLIIYEELASAPNVSGGAVMTVNLTPPA